MSSDLPIQFSLKTFSSSVNAEFPFYRGGKALCAAPKCAVTLRSAGSMRHKKENANRLRVFSSLELDLKKIAPANVCHSKNVVAARTVSDVKIKDGDGVITVNSSLIPSVTVADCMPIYLYEPRTGCFGILHSGWKGTGIVLNALDLAQSKYGACPQDFSVVLGPHIGACCYDIPPERAAFFSENFSTECVSVKTCSNTKKSLHYLSLAQANLSLLKKAGVPFGNIAVCSDCTCCSLFLGSFRRETAFLGETISLKKRFEYFTPMAAYVRMI